VHHRQRTRLPAVSGGAGHDLVTIGLDVGGTKIAGAVVDQRGDVLHREFRESRLDNLCDPDFGVSLPVAEELVRWCREHGHEVSSLGMGVPEYVRPDGHVTSRLVMDWDRQPLTAFEHLAPVHVDSDVRCAALAEALMGSAEGLATMAYVSVGTGLSHAFVVDGHVVQGARGEAIAFGELEPTALSEETGLSLEQYCSGAGIASRYTALTGRAAQGAREVATAADDGDLTAQQVLASAAAALGEGLAVLVKLLDPHVVVLGGGLGDSSGPWRAQVGHRYARAVGARPSPPPLARPRLGQDAGVIGAALAAHGEHARPSRVSTRSRDHTSVHSR
jgi:glucokinase